MHLANRSRKDGRLLGFGLKHFGREGLDPQDDGGRLHRSRMRQTRSGYDAQRRSGFVWKVCVERKKRNVDCLCNAQDNDCMSVAFLGRTGAGIVRMTWSGRGSRGGSSRLTLHVTDCGRYGRSAQREDD